MATEKKGIIRESVIDLGTGKKNSNLRNNTLDSICIQQSHILDHKVSANKYFSITRKGNAIFWFKDQVEAIQMEIRLDDLNNNYTKIELYLYSIIKELNK